MRKSGCKSTAFFSFFQIFLQKNDINIRFLCIFAAMLVKTEAIVLHSFKYGEQKLVVDMFTRQQGRLSFMVVLPRSSRGQLKKHYFQPLTALVVEVDVRPSLQFQKLVNATLLQPRTSLLCEPVKISIGLFVAEFLCHALKGEQQNELLFDYIASSIDWLDGCESGYANFHLVFLMRLSRFLGFYPNLELDDEGERVMDSMKRNEDSCYFDLRAGTFCNSVPVHRDFLMPQEARVLLLMMRMNYANMHLFRMNREQRNRCVEVALQFYRLHLPDFPDLRSLAVLHDLWA